MPTQANSSKCHEYTLKDYRKVAAGKQPAQHQTAALAKLNKWYAGLDGRAGGGILALPTGAGKTFTAVHFLCTGPLSDGYKVLWLAHTHHLLEQALGGFSVGVGQIREPRSTLKLRVVSSAPGHFPPRDIKPSDDVVLATLQTVTNAHSDNLRQLRAFLDSAKGKIFVVFDEAHHSPAPSYRKLLLDLREEGSHVLGLTATPTYSDESKKGWLKKLFPQGILAQARPAELMAAGILARPHFERAPTSVVPDFDAADYQKWLGTYGDIPGEVIEQLAKNAERNTFIAQSYAANRKKYGKTIIFTDRWYQCESIVEALRTRGVKADAIYSHVDAQPATVEGRRKRDRDENTQALARFRSGETDVLVNVRMLTEGTDLPSAQTVFLTRQTTSSILLTQMVGRALRGPKFGGTPEAYIVSFVDEWQQAIRWAEYDPLEEGSADDAVRPSAKRPPLQLISIDLVKRLARQLDSGVNVTTAPFTSMMPAGWYWVRYDAVLPGGDEVEAREELVLVFDDERQGFEKLIGELLKTMPSLFVEETITLEQVRPSLEQLRAKYLSGVERSATDLLVDIFHVARHISQEHGAPKFFPFEVRELHNLDAIVAGHRARDLRMSEIEAAVVAEYMRGDRFWRVLFPSSTHFRSQYDACSRRAGGDVGPHPVPNVDEAPTPREADQAVKDQVKRRDGGCLACGSTRYLQVDHIVPFYVGGSHDLDNLQTLCTVCHRKKAQRKIWFTTERTPLAAVPKALEQFEDPDDGGDLTHWERFLRRTINFTYECRAVSEIVIGGRGKKHYNWTIELVRGNSPAWMRPHIKPLFERIKKARLAAGKAELQSITVTAPGENDVCFPRPT